MTSGDRRIAATATGQLGAFSRAQAHDAGLSDRQLRRRVQSGTLVQTGPNGFRYAGSPATLLSELRALVLDIGEPVLVSGPTERHCTASTAFGFVVHITCSFLQRGTTPGQMCGCIARTRSTRSTGRGSKDFR